MQLQNLFMYMVWQWRRPKTKGFKLLEQVGLGPNITIVIPTSYLGTKTKGGHCQSTGYRTPIILLDESVAALDISIQAQVLNLLNDLKEQLKLSYLLFPTI